MVTAAAVISGLSLGKSVDDTQTAKRDAKRKEKELKDLKAEEKRKKAESTPFGGTEAGSRIAAEKQMLTRRGGSAGKSRQSYLG